MDERICTFLRKRGVEEASIKKMEDDKMDKSVIQIIDDEQLKLYLPHFGDRIALKAFCKEKEEKSEQSKKNNVLQRLRKRLMTGTDDSTAETGRAKNKEYLEHNTHAKKKTRKIELSWVNFNKNENTFKQVRTKRGGGTRKQDISKCATKSDILAAAKRLYFVEGDSKFGSESEFLFDLKDYKDSFITNEQETVEEMYTTTCMPLLHFTMTTKSKKALNEELSVHSSSDVGPVLTVHDYQHEAEKEDLEGSYNGVQFTPAGTPTVSFRTETHPVIFNQSNERAQTQYVFDEFLGSLRPTNMQIVVGEIIEDFPTLKATTAKETDGAVNIRSAVHTLKDAISTLSQNIIPDEKNNTINVDRDNVLDGALRGFKRQRFNPWTGLSVKFSAEQGIDNGGLSREFLQLAVDSIRKSAIFEGPENTRCFSLHYQALERGLYKDYATILAYSMAHGGPVPDFLNETTYRAISSDIENVDVDMSDIADYELKEYIRQLADCTEEEVFQGMVDQRSDLISLAGCMSLVVCLNQKHRLIQGLCHFIVIGRVANAIERFKEGLQTCGVLTLIQQHPDVMKEAFCAQPESALTPTTVDLLFSIENRSPKGSNKYAKEKTVEAYWRDFLEDLAELEMLDKLISFATGLRRIPLCGFEPKPRLLFGHLEDAENQYVARFPRSNTCALTLTIPVLDTYDEFKENMLNAVESVLIFTDE